MKLLLVEDDAKLSAALRRGLEAEGYAVEVATNGDDGLWRATEGAFDLIVLDIMLPGRNGYRVCADLRAAGVWTPILMLTAKDGELDEAEALDTGADDFLTKPFSYTVLVARVRALLRRAAERTVAACGRRRPAHRPRPPPGVAGRGRDRADRPRVRRARAAGAAGRPGAVQGPHPRRRVGRATSRATPTSSRSTCAGCGARSTSPSAAGRSRRVRGAGYRIGDDAG